MNSLKEICTVVLHYCYLCHKNLKVTSRRKCCKIYSFEAGYACRQCNRNFSIGFELRRRKVNVDFKASNVRVYISASNVCFELVQNKDVRTDVISGSSKCAETDSADTGGTSEETSVRDAYTSTGKIIDGMSTGDESDEWTDVDEKSDYSAFAKYIKKHANTGKTSDDTMCTDGVKKELFEFPEESENRMFAEEVLTNTGNESDDTIICADGIKREHSDSSGEMSEDNMLTEDEHSYTGNELDDTICADDIKREHSDSSGRMSVDNMLTEEEHLYTGNELDDTICADDVKREHSDSSGRMSEDNMLTENESANTANILDAIACAEGAKGKCQDTFELSDGSMFSGALGKDPTTIDKAFEVARGEHTEDSSELPECSMFDGLHTGDQAHIDKISASSVGGVKEHPNTDKISKNVTCDESLTKEYSGMSSTGKKLMGKRCEVFTTKEKTKRVKKRGRIKLTNNLVIDRTVKRSKRNGSKKLINKPSGTWSFTCEVCGIGFHSQTNLISHHIVHKRNKRWVCSVCNKCFSSKSYLKIHMRTHSEA